MPSKPVVLYVEDDHLSRMVLEILLTIQLDLATLHIFEDSANFLARVRALDPQPNLFFLDIHVKPISGFDMLSILRADPAYAKIPVIALTASVMNEEVQRLHQAGFDGCLAKPLDNETFAETFAHILAGERVWRILT